MSSRIEVLSRHLLGTRALSGEPCAATVATADEIDVAIVGAGFAGLYCLHKLRSLGLRARVYEKGSSVGGVWYWNRYPGAKCDVESLQYCFSFDLQLQQDWKWPEKYSQQADILKYLNHVADRYNLRPDIQLGTTVTACKWLEEKTHWSLELDSGSTVASRFLVMASGGLSERNWPKILGLNSFRGRLLHTQDWPTDPVDFCGRRVGVIGTGSSAVQAIPKIAETAGHLTVFQRTANYVIPARQAPMNRKWEKFIKANYKVFNEQIRYRTTLFPYDLPPNMKPLIPVPPRFEEVPPAMQQTTFAGTWEMGGISILASFPDFQSNLAANEAGSAFVKGKIRELVQDPGTANALCPAHLMVCKRLCVSDNWYETFNRPHVSLVDLKKTGGRIHEITPAGVRIGTQTYELDDLICATGFDAMTGALLAIDIQGRNGLTLRDTWADGAKTLLGLQVPGFPNMFTVTGPQSPTVLTNMVQAIEQHVDWIGDCIHHVHSSGKRSIEATPAGLESWMDHCRVISDGALISSSKCGNSWYVGANIEGKPRVMLPYVGSFHAYISRCNESVSKGYDGFIIQ